MQEWLTNLFGERPTTALGMLGSVVCGAVALVAFFSSLSWVAAGLGAWRDLRRAQRERWFERERAQQIDAWARRSQRALRVKGTERKGR